MPGSYKQIAAVVKEFLFLEKTDTSELCGLAAVFSYNLGLK